MGDCSYFKAGMAGNMVGVVGYNVQTAVDTKNHIIVAHKTTNIGTDRGQLTPIAKLARIVKYRFL